MEKIIATTDLSTNSKAGMRYAIQLSRLRKAKLVFLHVHQVLPASFWSDKEYKYFINENKKILEKEVESFVRGVYHAMKLKAENYTIDVHHNLYATDGIIEYSKKNKADYICISSRGAGTLKKIFGTNTSTLITQSNIPVLCVPSSYRTKPIKSLLYASDMNRYEKELEQVVAFARPLKAGVKMLHLKYTYEPMPEQATLRTELEKKFKYKINVLFQKREASISVLKDLEHVIKAEKPSLLVVFTNKKKSFFEKLLTPGNAKEYSYHAKIPFMSINK